MKKTLFIIIGCLLLLVAYYYINKDSYDYNSILIRDGEGLLLVRDSEILFLQAYNQKLDPSFCEYLWFHKSNANLEEGLSIGKMNTGFLAEGEDVIQIGSFKVSWSIESNGSGYFYLNSDPKWNAKKGELVYAMVMNNPDTFDTTQKFDTLNVQAVWPF